MPREARLIIDGGYYHIVTRGIDRRQAYIKYILQERPYDLIVDQAFRIT